MSYLSHIVPQQQLLQPFLIQRTHLLKLVGFKRKVLGERAIGYKRVMWFDINPNLATHICTGWVRRVKCKLDMGRVSGLGQMFPPLVS